MLFFQFCPCFSVFNILVYVINILKVKEVKAHASRSSSLPQKTLCHLIAHFPHLYKVAGLSHKKLI